MMTIYQTVRSNFLLLLTVLFAVTNIDAQEKFISISTEAAHITKDTEEWFNITGLRVDLEYAFKKPNSLYIDSGKLRNYRWSPEYTNTNQAYSRTFYETSKDVGTVFGLIYKYKINEETHISTSINVENYSDNYELSESYSLISNQFNYSL